MKWRECVFDFESHLSLCSHPEELESPKTRTWNSEQTVLLYVLFLKKIHKRWNSIMINVFKILLEGVFSFY